MTRPSGDPLQREIESLLAAERLPVVAPRDTLQNALRRARVALHEEEHSHIVRVGRRPEPRRVAKLIAVPIALGASWALAHRAGYPVQFWASEDPSVEQTSSDASSGAESRARKSQSRGVSEAPSVSEAPGVSEAPAVEPPAQQAKEAPAASAQQGANEAPAPTAKAVNPTAQDARAAAKSNDKASVKPAAGESTRELAMLQLAQRAVARRQFGAALARIAEHQRAFPSGALSEEREALRIKALVGLGKAGEARQAAGDFQKKFPNSALQGRIHVPPQAAK